jgi:hypothetical protein
MDIVVEGEGGGGGAGSSENLLELPGEVVGEIVGWLPVRDICNFSSISHRAHELAFVPTVIFLLSPPLHLFYFRIV